MKRKKATLPDEGTPGESGPGLAIPSALLPLAAFCVLFFATLHQWYVPFADSAREVAVPLRLAGGQLLYRDVAYQYGPLTPLLDAAALLVLGRSLWSLLAVRVAVSLVGIEALRRLVLRQVRSPFLSASIVTAVVTSCCFLPNGGAWPFPYSAASLEGTVGTWAAAALAIDSRSRRRSLLAAAVAGLTACTKVEFAVTALLAALLPLLLRRPRREALGAAALALAIPLAAWGVPLAAFGVDTLKESGFLVALQVPESWGRLYRNLFWGGPREEFLGPATALRFAISGAYLLAAGAVLRLSGRLGRWGIALSLGVGALAAAIPSNREIQLLVPLSFLLLAAAGWHRWRQGRFPSWVRDAGALLAFGAAVLPAVRQPFSIIVGSPYSAFSAPGAAALSLSVLSAAAPAPALAGAFLVGLSASQAVDRVREYREGPRQLVRSGRGVVSLYACEAVVVGGLVEWLEKSTPPGSVVAGLPSPGFVLFLADRRSPLVDDLLNPGTLSENGEETAARTLATSPLAAGFLVNRPFGEFGFRFYGEGFGTAPLRAFEQRFVPAGTIGGPSPGCPPTALVDTALLFLPRAK